MPVTSCPIWHRWAMTWRYAGGSIGMTVRSKGLGRPCAFVRGFGGCAASHVEGTGPARAFRAILVGSPWVVVTVPALVLCARLLGWSRESATTSLVTGPVLIPVGRLHIFPSLPPPRLSLGLFPASGGHYDTL